jgi:hypothetical protein
MTKTVRFLTYALCALFMLGLYASVSHLLPGKAWFGVYYCFSFWSMVCTEAYLTMGRKLTIRSKWAAEDRFLAYLFTAPFVWPVRLFELFSGQVTAPPVR